MRCPVCNIELKMTERQGVEIDYCAQCRGVWLDRGELDKIIERANVERSPVERVISIPYEGRRDVDEYERYGPHRRKRKSFLGELFDFD